MRIFLCRNIIDKVESAIHLWNDAKQAKFWLPWPTMFPGLEESDFRAYAEACQNLMWSLLNVRLTTPSSELCSSLMDRLKSKDVHSAGPTAVCVSYPSWALPQST